MKTHELAALLRYVVDRLASLPDFEITSYRQLLKDLASPQQRLPEPQTSRKRDGANVEILFEALRGLNKADVGVLISTLELPVTVRSRDSAEDLALKVRTYLSPNPPKDTDGRREESGRGVRELQGK